MKVVKNKIVQNRCIFTIFFSDFVFHVKVKLSKTKQCKTVVFSRFSRFFFLLLSNLFLVLIGGTLEQIVALCTSGVMKPFCDLLDVNDEKTLCVVMDGLVNLLAAAASQGEAEKICEMVEECEGLDKLEALQQHENELVYKKALHIIETYFAEEDEAPDVETNGQEFAFSQPATSNPGQSGGFNF